MVAIKNLSEHNVMFLGKDGRVHHTLPGDVFPAWAASQVTNPLVVGDQRTDPKSRKAQFDEELAELRARHGVDEDGAPVPDDTEDEDGDEDEPGPERAPGEAPPRVGKGSGIDAWRDFAIDQEVEIEQEWTKEQIITDLEKAGKL